MESNKMKYTISITNNETGETDTTDACAIIYAANNGESVETSRKLDCDAIDLVCTMAALVGEIQALLGKHPELEELLDDMLTLVEADAAEETEDK